MKSFDPTADISNHDALDIIRDIFEYGQIVFTPHAREEMKNGNFTPPDVIHILENGSMSGKEFDAQRSNWKYRIKGKDNEGVYGVVMTAVINQVGYGML